MTNHSPIFFQNKHEKIMLFIPAYNCEKQVLRVLRSITPDIAKRFAEIVVIENRATDGTLKSAELGLSEIHDCKVTLLQNDENYSLGGSHKVAFNYMLDHGHDYLVVLHGDDQGDIHDILPIIDSGEHHKYDVLLGSRFEKDSKLIGYSKFRVFGNVVLNAVLSVLTATRITDMGSGLNMYSREFLSSRFYALYPNDLTFNIYSLFYGIWKKSNFKFFPLTWKESDQVSNAKMFKQARNILKLTFEFAMNKEVLNKDFVKGKAQYTSKVIYQHN